MHTHTHTHTHARTHARTHTLHLVGFGSHGQRQQLVPQADSKQRLGCFVGDVLNDVGDGGMAHLRVAWPIAQQ